MRAMLFSLICAGLVLPAAAEAQMAPGAAAPSPAPVSGRGGRDFIRRGSGALLFTMGGVLSSTPASFDGVGVGGLWFLSEKLGIRGALGYVGGSDETENRVAGNTNKTEDKTSLLALEGGAQLLVKRSADVHLYVGGIVQVQSGSTDPDGADNDVSVFGFTAAGLLGGNWFFAEHMTLGAEYRLGYQTTKTETERGQSKTTQTVSGFGVGSAAINLGFWFE